ncbi:c-type cytochrome [Bartonella tamiae]|uniref:Cytochrome c domain-containing protein n=1 Tax=Bartonella tamiae Th239 TaxID=1094558 RepID=J0QYU1_9HYPH|nr:cytochrome c family protein [Bartonella tamiae]EJF91281.1 hypothetical protein ME5_00613 [Bartonella tamiae Th239]EJF93054.1 hypothetical protein MEG_01268 [Bartonella tamiae Th307]
MRVSTVNSIICVCLFWLIVLFAIIFMSNLIYDTPQVQDKNAQRDALINLEQDEKPSQSLQTTEIALSTRLKKGDIKKGAQLFGQCGTCHSGAKDGSNRVGPPLWDIVNRPFAFIQNFSYSRAMRDNADKHWNFATLDTYLRAPRKMIPGTIMTFPGIKNDQDRADLLLYLRMLSDSPVDLPQESLK